VAERLPAAKQPDALVEISWEARERRRMGAQEFPHFFLELTLAGAETELHLNRNHIGNFSEMPVTQGCKREEGALT
jgi:hypothetical protein